MKYAPNYERIRKQNTDIGRFWSAAHRAAAKRDRQEKATRRELGRLTGKAALA